MSRGYIPPLGKPAPRNITYDLACDEWARRLTEGSLRELASEYMRGSDDEAAADAYREFQRRDKAGLLSEPDKGSSLRAPKSKRGNQSRK